MITPTNLIVLAGAGQLCLALGSLAIPWLLRWPEELARVRPLTLLFHPPFVRGCLWPMIS